jgi:hypothetical protein
MSINKMTLNLTVAELNDLITKELNNSFKGYIVKLISYKMTDAGTERFVPVGHKFTGVDIVLEKAGARIPDKNYV